MTLDAAARITEEEYISFSDGRGLSGEDRDKAIIVDLDGTLAVHNGARDPYDWEKCGDDFVEPVIHELVKMVAQRYRIIICSGRPERSRAICEEWLKEVARLHYARLYLRKDGDFRSDDIIKEEIFFDQIQQHFDVRFVLDDRQQVVDMWRRIGLKCLQVAPGDF